MNARKQATIINAAIGFLSQLVIVIIGIIVPRIMIVNYGSDINGLISTITQIFTYVALLEAGIGQASQNALYPQLKNDNKNGISKIMSLSRRYYRRVSYIYFLSVVVLSFSLPAFLKTSVNYWTIFLFVFFEGLSGFITFYFTASWTYFLNSVGKTYITNSIGLVSKLLVFVVKVVLAINSVNIAFIQIFAFVISLLGLLFYTVYMKKQYGWIDYNSCDLNDKLPDRNSYIVTEIATVVFSSTDMIVISIFISTSISSVYSVHNMVFVALEGLINSVYFSLKYILGQTYNKNINDYKKMHNVFNSLFLGSTIVFSSVAYLLLPSFVSLYTEGVTDVNYSIAFLPLLFCAVQILSRSRSIAGNLTGLSGHAKTISYFSAVEAIFNITLSIIFVHLWGVCGVLLATIISLPIKIIAVNYISEIKVMKRSPLRTICIFLSNFLIFGITVLISFYVKIEINSYLWLILNGGVLFCFYLIICLVINMIVNKDFLLFVKKTFLNFMDKIKSR